MFWGSATETYTKLRDGGVGGEIQWGSPPRIHLAPLARSFLPVQSATPMSFGFYAGRGARAFPLEEHSNPCCHEGCVFWPSCSRSQKRWQPRCQGTVSTEFIVCSAQELHCPQRMQYACPAGCSVRHFGVL